jgi:hypothetical protein
VTLVGESSMDSSVSVLTDSRCSPDDIPCDNPTLTESMSLTGERFLTGGNFGTFRVIGDGGARLVIDSVITWGFNKLLRIRNIAREFFGFPCSKYCAN